MKKYLVTTVLFVCIAFLAGSPGPIQQSFDPVTIQTVLDHSLAVVVYFEVPKDQVDGLIQRAKDVGLAVIPVTPDGPFQVPLQDQQKQAVAIIGAGTLLKDRYVLSVAHLVEQEGEAGVKLPVLKAWAVQRNTDHPIELEIIANTNLRSAGCPFYNDYAVFRLKENLGLPGIKIAADDAYQGQMVMQAGTVSGAAFFARFGYVTRFQSFFRRDEAGNLRLSQWTSFQLVCVYPGGGGDSGGGIFNANGEVVGVMYCGLELATETYVFANPLELLRDFLEKNKLSGLLQ